MCSRSFSLLAGLALVPGMTFAQQVQQPADLMNEPEQELAEVAPLSRTIFQAAQAPQGATGLKHSRGLHAVVVQFDQLDQARPGDIIRFETAPGSLLDLEVTSLERRADDRYSVSGVVRSAPGSQFILVREIDALAGDVRLPTANLHFKMKFAGVNDVGQTVHLVNDINDSLYGECGGATPLPENAQRGFDPVPEPWESPEVPAQLPEVPFGERGGCTNIQPVWDVMVVYTNLALDAAGGTNAINAEVQLGVDTANQTFTNSNVNARYRLVWRGVVTYDEVGAMTDHRDRLRDPNDGVYDWINVTRDTVNADMCAIWTQDDDGNQWCGFAFCEVTADAAYVSCNWECAAGNFSYPHEHGHGQGCAHDPDNAGSCPLYSYSYGHRWTVGSNSYRSVMAYNTTNGPFVRVGHWSNPDVDYLGVATGTATRDNARTLDNTARDVEDFQITRYDVWVDEDLAFPAVQIGTYSFPYDTISEGIGAIDVPFAGASEDPNLRVITGTYTTYTGTISKKMNIIPCGGAVTIGTP